MKFPAICIALLIATPLCACYWDRDTIALEAQGRLEVVETMVGWFDRFPAEYYQMRLDRVAREVGARPEQLELYDDAAVACDHLGRHDEAVVWMEKKAARMQPLPAEQTKDHRYRMHANRGVFRTHQWLKTPERNNHPEKLDAAIAEVQAALVINPDAHFGRERAHLCLLQWWQAGLKNRRKATDPDFKYAASRLAEASMGDFPDTSGLSRDALIKGFCGLIQMGSAQDSVDVHSLVAWHFMGLSTNHLRLDHSEVRHTLCYLTCLRIAELVAEGRQPICASDPFRAWLQPETHFKNDSSMPRTDQAFAMSLTRVNMWGGEFASSNIVPPWFDEVRAAAKERLAAKTRFMQGRFAAGLHPDTHPDFWEGWHEPPMPALPRTQLEQRVGIPLAAWLSNYQNIQLLLFALVGVCVMGLYLILLLRRRRARQPQLAPAP